MSNGLFKEKIAADLATPADGDSIVSYLFDGSGNAISSTGGSLDVNITNAGDIQVAVNSEYAEDSASGSGDILSAIAIVRQDSLSSLVDTDGDYGAMKMDSLGRVWVNSYISGQAADLTIADGGNVISVDDAGGSLTVDGSVSIIGGVADDDADSGNPIKVGSRSVFGLLSALSTTGDRGDLVSDKYRRPYMSMSANVGHKVSVETVGATAAQILSTPSAGRQQLFLQNDSASPIYIGYDNTVTTTGSTRGFRLRPNMVVEVAASENIPFWAISTAAGKELVCWELG